MHYIVFSQQLQSSSHIKNNLSQLILIILYPVVELPIVNPVHFLSIVLLAF